MYLNCYIIVEARQPDSTQCALVVAMCAVSWWEIKDSKALTKALTLLFLVSTSLLAVSSIVRLSKLWFSFLSSTSWCLSTTSSITLLRKFWLSFLSSTSWCFNTTSSFLLLREVWVSLLLSTSWCLSTTFSNSVLASAKSI
ncbi:unnamed protein product, partial [Vitis vinifera]